jgi:small subunit ribosomal protein S8
MLTRIVHN